MRDNTLLDMFVAKDCLAEIEFSLPVRRDARAFHMSSLGTTPHSHAFLGRSQLYSVYPWFVQEGRMCPRPLDRKNAIARSMIIPSMSGLPSPAAAEWSVARRLRDGRFFAGLHHRIGSECNIQSWTRATQLYHRHAVWPYADDRYHLTPPLNGRCSYDSRDRCARA